MMTLGQKIQAIRKAAGLSQEAFGEVLHVSRQAVSKWEGDGGVPELDTLILMSRRFHVSLTDLLGMDEDTADEGVYTPDPSAAPLSPEMQDMQDALMHACAPAAPKADPSPAQEPVQQPDPEPAQSTPRRPISRRLRILAGGALAGLLLLAVWLPAKSEIRTLRAQLNTVQSRLSALESSMNQQNGALRSTILSVLEEQNDPVSSMDIQVSRYDPATHTAELSLCAVLKTAPVGTEGQFLLQWTDDSGAARQGETAWVTAYPEAHATFSLPVGEGDAQLCCCLRLRSADGTLSQSPWENASLALSREVFQLQLKGSLSTLTSLSYANTITTMPEFPTLTLYSPLAELQPLSAQFTLLLEAETVCEASLTVSHTADMDAGCYLLSPADADAFPQQLSLQKGQTLTYLLQITDSFDQVLTFRTVCRTEEDGLSFEEFPTSVTPQTP